MSYILDALRKSEAARRSREAPDLLAQTAAPLQPAPAKRAPQYAGRPAWAVASLGLCALAVALWLRFAPTADAPANPPEASSEDTSQRLDGTPVDGRPVDSTGLRPHTGAGPVADGAPSLDPGRPPGVIPGMAPVATPAPEPVPPEPVPPEPVPPAAAPAPAAPRQPAPIARAPVAPHPRPAPVTDTRNLTPPMASTAAASPPAATAPPLATDGRPVALADITPEQRRQLPPLRMSMHLWNEAPERRLLVLDGQRLRQGDVIGEVVVERIDRDGAVLAWRGARIRLPVE